MKTLLLMRHARSSWKDPKLADSERPLTGRGRLTAPQVGLLLQEQELVPQLILSSTALRARQTVEFAAAGAGFTGEVQYLSSLYLAEPETCLGVLSVVPDEFERVMIVGHNPGLESLVQILSRRIVGLPTGKLAYISLPLQSWKDLSFETEGELAGLIVLTKEQEDRIKEQIKDANKIKKDEKKVEKKEEKKEDKKVEKKGKK